MRVNGSPLVSLPSKTIHTMIHTVLVKLTPHDQKAYDLLNESATTTTRQHLVSGSVSQNYLHILEILLRLRQVYDSSSLVSSERIEALRLIASSKSSGSQAPLLDKAALTRLFSILSEGASEDTHCGHIFCMGL